MSCSVDKIRIKKLYKTVCEVKEQWVYTDDALREWLNILYNYDYNVAYYSQYTLMLRRRGGYDDVFILYSKRPIDKTFLHSMFVFKDITSLITLREFKDAIKG